MSTPFIPASFPLSPPEMRGRNHAHIAFFAYFFGLPLGVLIARYLRTFTNRWLLVHMIVNGLLVGPLVIAAYVLGVQTTKSFGQPQFRDPHQKVGLALFIMYWLQLALGLFIHYVKFPRTFRAIGGHRPQNFLHITLGLATIALASWQTHYGLYTEWAFVTGNAHPVASGCKHFWLAILIIFWSLFAIGLALLPRQIKQERAARAGKAFTIESKEGTPPVAA